MRDVWIKLAVGIIEMQVVKKGFMLLLGSAYSNNWIAWFVMEISNNFMGKIVTPLICIVTRKGLRVYDDAEGKYYYVKLTKHIEEGDWNGVSKTVYDMES